MRCLKHYNKFTVFIVLAVIFRYVAALAASTANRALALRRTLTRQSAERVRWRRRLCSNNSSVRCLRSDSCIASIATSRPHVSLSTAWRFWFASTSRAWNGWLSGRHDLQRWAAEGETQELIPVVDDLQEPTGPTSWIAAD